MRLLLIRHGQTTSNVDHMLDTAEPGAVLTPLGRRQAQAIPEALNSEEIELLFVSTLRRTLQTAEPLARHRELVPIVRAGIREIQAGDLEMRNDQSSIDLFVETVFGWADDIDRRIPGAENGRDVLARFDSVVHEAAESGRNHVALVAHGGIIRYWTGMRSHNVDLAYAAGHWLPNTGMVVLEGDPVDGWWMHSWAEHALGGPHLSDPSHTGPTGEPEEALEPG